MAYNQHPLFRVLTAASAVGAASLLYRGLGGEKLLSDSLPKAARMSADLRDQLSTMELKDYTVDNIKNAINTIKSNESDFQTQNPYNNLAELDTTGNGFVGALVKMKELMLDQNHYIKPLFNQDYANVILNDIERDNQLSGEEHNVFSKLIKHVVENNDLALMNNSDNTFTLNEDLIDKFFAGLKDSPNKDSYVDILNRIQENYLDAGEYKTNFNDWKLDNGGKINNYIKNVLEQFNAKNMKEKFGTGDNRSLLDLFLGKSRPMTLGDYLANEDKFKNTSIKIGEKGEIYNVGKLIREWVDNNPESLDIIMDETNLRMDDQNNILNLKPIKDFQRKVTRKFAGTLPGKIIKETDRINKVDSALYEFLSKDRLDLIGGGLDKDNKNKSILNKNYVKILGDFYEITEGLGLVKKNDMEDVYTTDTAHGTIQRYMRAMAGGNAEKAPKGKIKKFFDIGTTNVKSPLEEIGEGTNFLSKWARKFTGQTQENIMANMFDPEYLYANGVLGYRDNAYKVSSALSNITKVPTNPTMKEIGAALKDDYAKEIMEIAQLDDTNEMINRYMEMNKKMKFDNENLISLIKSMSSDRHKIKTKLSIKDDTTSSLKNVLDVKGMIKREAFKEALLKEARTSDKTIDYSRPLNVIKNIKLGNDERKNAELLLNWASIQKEGKLFNSTVKNKEEEYIYDSVTSLFKFINYSPSNYNQAPFSVPNSSYIQSLRDNLIFANDNYKNAFVRTERRKDLTREIEEAGTNAAIMMRKGYSPIKYVQDINRDINDNIKLKAHTKKFFGQFVAGRKHPEYITEYTMVPYFLTHRLIEPFNTFGLGASNKNTGSVLDEWKFIMGKRVVPVALGITAGSYLNYRAKAYTGTSLSGAFVNGMANIDIGARKIADVTGIGRLLKADRSVNPITQYWLGDKYQDAEARRDYYANGYSPVRKSRWWSFGSASEFRGGKISYFQPSIVRRANSDWKDIGVYGSTKEKWAHSWIPTPRHPLSTVRRLLDPYWLERKHYYDRPYLETAPLFSSQTPWGAVLNPTIGQLIKPIRRMHKNEVRHGYIDPRQLIRERNERIKQKAFDKQRKNVVEVQGNVMRTMKYVPNAAPVDRNQVLMTFTARNGKLTPQPVQGLDYEENLPNFTKNNVIGLPENADAKTKTTYYQAIGQGGYGTGGSGYGTGSGGYGTGSGGYGGSATGGAVVSPDKGYIEGTPLIELMASNGLKTPSEALNIVRQVNTNTFKKASQGGRFSTFTKLPNGLLLNTNPAADTYTAAANRFNAKRYLKDLRLTSSRHDFVSDAIYSLKELSGIYGFMSDVIFADKRRKIRPDNAERMSSFITKYWDVDMGGFGGGIMEIARRFFPHLDRSFEYKNPVMNTMPDWIPGRFRTGDPYTKVAKGEMRLPGKGYESINKLHSDAYGRYGALDRMKILGDVAPWSDEYKIWRNIAKQTVTDKKGLQEIKGIEERVDKVSRAHEFYPYKFIHTPTVVTNENVQSISGNEIIATSGRHFTVAGVSGKYNLAQFMQQGVSFKAEYLKQDRKNGSIEASITIDGHNINQQIAQQMGIEGDKTSVMGAKAFTDNKGRVYGAVMETIAHAPIPFVHNKLLRVNTPLESYKNEQVYGSAYATWEHPIKGFLLPAFRKAWARGPVGQGLALGAWVGAEQVWKNSDKIKDSIEHIGIDISKDAINKAASIGFTMINPGAWSGAMLSMLPLGATLDTNALKDLFSAGTFGSAAKPGIIRNSARAGAAVMLAGYGFSRSDKPIQSTAFFAGAGAALAKQIKWDKLSVKGGAQLGAMFGFGLSMARNGGGGFKGIKESIVGSYIPKETKRRRDIEEYFDRLDYIKYTGLYNKAAKLARIKEGVSVKEIVSMADNITKENQDRVKSIRRKMNILSNSIIDEGRKQQLLELGENEIINLTANKASFRGGKYTRAAIAYRQAARSTVYGLDETSSMQEIMRAIPKTDKDFFSEFIKETNPQMRKKILKMVSPYERKALQIAWGEKYNKPKSNIRYFNTHALPNIFWAGWSPQVDTDDIKIKTIENEGMQLSDFGIYESEAKEPEAEYAPSVGRWDNGARGVSGPHLITRLTGALNGAGLIGVNVSVEPSSGNGINVLAHIKESVTIADYKMRQGIQGLLGVRMFY